ncbi:uncharacterized protein BCR38DRAFT_441842 [Pseudomassariella vexata]|uniref:Uncharacterized protein n=1 Tax=Pseudomassariella vexata TaxID=1141098 RepID=A0A1Y2DN97_9PEZI|nr:uncharacterized protein BCR38DRAFT_441842 [Pseudomassariella vexata]ORY60649.1 hypothetical protein BCR38DRAFT_441842 [Pseudomassariella vexata]
MWLPATSHYFCSALVLSAYKLTLVLSAYKLTLIRSAYKLTCPMLIHFPWRIQKCVEPPPYLGVVSLKKVNIFNTLGIGDDTCE